MPRIDGVTAEQIARLLDRGAVYGNGEQVHESYWFRDGRYIVERGDRRRWEDTREVLVLDAAAFMSLLEETDYSDTDYPELMRWIRDHAHLCAGTAA